MPNFINNQILEDLRTQHCIIVHFSHYMFRPCLAAIFRWFTNTKYIQGSCVCEPPEDGRQMGPKHVVWEVHNKI
jgi:hypothetical protein